MKETNEDKNLKKVINLIAITFMGLFFILAINTAISLYEILGENYLQQLYIIFITAFMVGTGLYIGVLILYYIFKGLKYLYNKIKLGEHIEQSK